MASINITFPDGSVKQYESGITPLQIAESLSSQLARDVLAATVNDKESVSTNGKTLKASTHSGTRRPTFSPKLSRSYIPA